MESQVMLKAFVCAIALLTLAMARSVNAQEPATSPSIQLPGIECHTVLYRVPEIVTRGRFPDGGESDSTWRTQEARHVGSDTIAQDFDAPQVRGLARKTKDGPQARRLLALAAIYDGATRTEAAKIGGVGL